VRPGSRVIVEHPLGATLRWQEARTEKYSRCGYWRLAAVELNIEPSSLLLADCSVWQQRIPGQLCTHLSGVAN